MDYEIGTNYLFTFYVAPDYIVSGWFHQIDLDGSMASTPVEGRVLLISSSSILDNVENFTSIPDEHRRIFHECVLTKYVNGVDTGIVYSGLLSLQNYRVDRDFFTLYLNQPVIKSNWKEVGF